MMIQSNGRGFAPSISSRGAQPHRLRALLVGTALGGSLAVIAAAAPTPAKAECAGPPDAVICTAGEYTTITYSSAGPLSVTLEPDVVVLGELVLGPDFIVPLSGVTLQGENDIHFSAGPGTVTNGLGAAGVSLSTTSGSIVAHSEDTTGANAGIVASTPDGTVTIHSTSAQTTGSGILPVAIGGYGFAGVVIEAVDVNASGYQSHGILGLSDGGTVSILATGEVHNDGETTGVGIGGVGRFGVTIDSAVIRTEGGYGFASVDLPTFDVALDEFVPSVGIHGRSYEGDVAITSDDILTSGDGAIGIYARARAGDVAIDSKKVATSGHGATGILVNAAGKVDITSTEVTTGGGVLGDLMAPVSFDGRPVIADAIHATSTGDAVTITSGTASASGAGARGIDAKTDSGTITIDAGLTTASGDGVAIGGFVFGDVVVGGLPRPADAIHAESGSGAIIITSQEAHATGASSAAISAVTQTGSIEITSGTATGDRLGIGASAFAGTVSIDSGSVEVAGEDGVLLPNGITALGGHGVTIKSDTVITHSTESYGILGVADDFGLTPTNGTVHIESGAVTTSGVAGVGIGGFAQGDVTIDSGTINTTGVAVEYSNLDGLIYLTYAPAGLIADSRGGDVDITSDSINTYGDLAFALRGRAEEGAVTIASGFVLTTGHGAAGVVGIGSGAVTITSENVMTTGNTRWVTGSLSAGYREIYSDEIAYADAIHAQSTGDAVTITSGAALADGAAARGIDAKTDSGAITIDAGLTTTNGDGGMVPVGDFPFGPHRTADAIHAESVSGAIIITSEEAHATGASSAAISAVTQTGSIEISSGTATGVTGGITGSAWNGSVSIDSGSVEVAGEDGLLLSNGISALGLSGVTIKSGTVITHSSASYGIFGRAENAGLTPATGAVHIESGVVTTTGAAGGGIGGFAQGDVTIDSGTITTTGAALEPSDPDDEFLDVAYPSLGLIADSVAGDIDITSGSISTQGDLSFALRGRAEAGAVTIASGSVATAGHGAAGVVGLGSGAVSITSENASTAGNSRWVTGNLSAGARVIYSDEIAYADAIHAESVEGGVSIVSGQVSASGLGARGIHAEGATDISIVAAGASVTGDSVTLADEVRLSHAIFASSAGGIIDVEVTGAVSSAQASGIHAEASTGAVAIKVGSGASVSGAHSAIDVEAAGGATIVNAGSIIGAGDGPAMQLTAGDDTVTLQTGSAITGAVLGGAGVNVANLDGASAAATQAQTLAHFVDFGQLNVDAGYWTATGHQSEFDSVTIGANGGLEVRDFLTDDDYYSAVNTASVLNNGLLVINFSQGAEDSDGFTVTGTGILRLSGAGTFNVTSDTIAHTGGTIVDAGKLVLTTDSLQGDLVINQGGTFQIGDGGTVGSFAGDILDNGTLIFNRSDYYEFTGALYGSGSLVKMGDSQLFLSGDYGFTGATTLLGGTLKLANVNPDAKLVIGGGQLDLSGGDHEVAGLTGEGGGVDIDQGSLTIKLEGTDVFGGEITGSGAVVISGGGTLNLTGVSTYTGDTTIGDGVLKVNGSIVSDVFIAQGGTLGGNGAVADVVVESGGTVGPGNSIGLLNVVGDIAFGEGSNYEVEVNAAGQGDRIVATGEANLTGGTVEVLAEAGTYNRLTTYNILTAAGGVNGEFDDVTTNFAYLAASLDYTVNDVLLTLARNDLAFSAMAFGANQVAVADAVQAAGEGDLYDAVLFQSQDGAAESFDALSGEFYGSSTTAMLAQSRYSREATLGRLRDADGGPGVWISAYGAQQTWDADGSAEARNNLGGVMLGADMGVGAWRAGAAVGQERSRTEVAALGSQSETETTTLAGYGGFGAGALAARVGVAYAMHKVQADRDVAFPNFAETASADFDGTTTQLFAEAGYKIPLVGGSFEPFANVAAVRTTIDAFTETGGAAALSLEESEREVVFASVGARFTVDAQLPYGVASPYVSLAYGNASGDTDGVSAHAFDTGEAFTVTGAGVNDNALLLDTGFDWHISENAEAGFAYQGAFGDDADEQSVRVEFSLKF